MLNVIIADDSLIIRKNLRMILEEMGHNIVAEAVSGQSAIDLYKEHNPDVITMDVTMPNLTGIEALQEIKKLYPDASVVMITSHGQEELVLEAIKSGAKGYILKPINMDKVQEIFEKIFPHIIEDEFF